MKLTPRASAQAGLALLLISVSGCVTPAAKEPALCRIRDSGGPAIPEVFAGTVGRTRRTRAATHVVNVTGLETGCCRTFDRVVFDFEGLRLPPRYTVEYVTGPIIACRSNETVPVAGNAKLKITFDEAQAHSPTQEPLFPNQNRRLNCPNLKQVVVACDFEGLIEVVLGLDAKRPYRVVELLNDSKLIIDVQH